MRERQPGSEPQSGDRVPYILIDTGDPKAKAFEKSEDPKYAKDKYVTELAAPLTVNTMPEATLRAVHELKSTIKDSISSEIANAHKVLQDLSNVGIDYNQIVSDLEIDGIKKFEESWQHLLQTVKQALA
jgi:transaldolase